MYYNNSFPVINYNSFFVSDNTVRIAVDTYVKENIDYFFEYTVQDYERPETVAFDFYGNSKLGWVLIVINDIQDPFHDWVMDQSIFRKYLIGKYIGDSIDPNEWHHFEDENGTTIPDPMTDSLRAKYGISNLDNILFQARSYFKDGKRITEPSSEVERKMFRQSFFDYEENKNEQNRFIRIPRVEFIDQIESELTALLNV